MDPEVNLALNVPAPSSISPGDLLFNNGRFIDFLYVVFISFQWNPGEEVWDGDRPSGGAHQLSGKRGLLLVV